MSQAPEIRPFAFMRLTHEAIRDGVQRCVALAGQLPDDDAHASLRTSYAETRRCIEAHATIEERGFFPLLDERFDGIAQRAGFRDEHIAEDAHHRAIIQAFTDQEAGDDSALQRLAAEITAWQGEIEHHLVHEEEIMMPLTQQISDTTEGRARAVRAIMDTSRADVDEVLIPWVAQRLEATKPFGPVWMFASAVRAAHPGADRARIDTMLRSALQPETVQRLEGSGALG